MSSPVQNLDHLKIPLEDILEATNNFSDKNFIKQGGFGKIYKGTLLRSGEMIDIVARRLDTTYGQGSKEFWTEVSMLDSLKHENLVSIVGFCDEKNEKIVINKYEAKESLDNYLSDPSLTWLQRLKICVGVARALSYIYYDEKRDFSVIHRNIKSSKILLDDNYEPKLAGFNLSITNKASRRHRVSTTDPCGTTGYVDPTYVKTDSVSHKSDIYSYGVVLFEVLFGREAIINHMDTKLAQLAKSHYEATQLDDLISSDLRKQMNQESLDIFSEAAYNCLKEQWAEQRSIDQIVIRLEKALNLQREQANPKHQIVAAALESTSNSYFRWKGLEHLKISSSDVESAIANCQNNPLYKSVLYAQCRNLVFFAYKAQLKIFDSKDYLEMEGKSKGELPKKMSTVTILRYFDYPLFYENMSALSTYKHPNVASVHGICDEHETKCIVYDVDVTNGCLADYFGSARNIDNFTWVRRIRLCINVAHGLDYIHGRRNNNETRSHHAISSSNILLKENWEPMIGGFSEDDSSVYSVSRLEDRKYNFHTEFYGGDRKEKDIYCFGIVLFEILCWRFAHDPIYQRKNDKGLASFVRRCFKTGTQNEILDLIKLTEEAEETIFSKGIDKKSLDTFSNIAYRCLGDSHFQRPTINQVIEELEKALYFQENRRNNLKFPLEKIMSATQNFNRNKRLGNGGFGQVYKGEFTGAHGCEHVAVKRLDKTSAQGITELMTEFEILSDYKHENIVGLVGYCDEKEEKIIVYEYACRGSLDRWLEKDALTWRKRLKICVDIANGLAFLHGTSETKQDVVIHRDIKSANVLLYGDWQAKIADFGLSLISPINHEMDYVIDNAKGTPGYCDPLYINTRFFTKESDIYSFGVLLFEMLCGRFVMDNENSKAQNLVQLVKHHYKEGSLDELVFEASKKQMVPISLTTFQNIACQCIHEEREKRPTVKDVLIQLKKALKFQEKIENINISLDDIMLATQDFSLDNLIGEGGSGPLYKGQVTCAHGCEIIAAKRLDRMSDQRETERITELEVLLEYKHENIIALFGLCFEKQENIMVYEYTSKGSLDRWLKDDGLTWKKRLEICIDITRGLAFLHGTSREKQEVVIHGDIKSENVLLNDDWKAKIADFGQSLINPINQETKYVVNTAKGTPGYCDPLYTTTGVLTKESDIYSLGVLLFEMLCGRSVMEHNSSRAHNLIHLVRDLFEEGTLYEIVFEPTKKQMVPASLTAFQSIAYQCIHEEREKRPTAQDVLIQLKKALEFQEVMERLTQMTDSREIYHVMNNTDLYTWPNKGILHRDHKVMFSFGTYGMVETISATEFQFKSYYRPNKWRTPSKSRFGEAVQISDSSSMNIQISVKTQLLSPGVNYGVYLVYKFCRPIDESTTRTHKLAIKMGSEDLFSEFTTRSTDNDGWMRIELYRFSNLKEEASFDAFLMGFSEDPFKNVALYVEGVEFQPISNMTREEIEELEKASITNGGGSIDEDEVGCVWLWVAGILCCPCLTLLCPFFTGWAIFKVCEACNE